ncbi:Translation initiation factor [Sulfidibacter corallicola]|uniref:Translation initiation factor n=1 Tax=Sulfidibacter corallicola TaxID=2818388 RepID=A0A8A4TGU2_SULCO|nr:hypothetical protein [Sulfidibacter corallicola]QTD48737.1 translation initiation factor [Sulfidibacter corallicola]
MARKKKERLDFSQMGELRQNPFADLAQSLGVAPANAAPAGDEPNVNSSSATHKPQPALLIRKEKRAKGKVVTCVYHLLDPHSYLKKLKTRFGTGGTIQDDVMELRGDHCEPIKDFFRAEGFKVR